MIFWYFWIKSEFLLGPSVVSVLFGRNLLLPRGMAPERPWARFRLRIYRAEGLPTMDAGLMAKMSKVTDRTVFIDPYVQVTFAGQQVQKHVYVELYTVYSMCGCLQCT